MFQQWRYKSVCGIHIIWSVLVFHMKKRNIIGYQYKASIEDWCIRGSRGGQGGRTLRHPPPKNHTTIGIPSNIGPDPLKITKLPSQHSMLCHHRHASETPCNGPLKVVLRSSLPSQQLKNTLKLLDPLWTNFWIRLCDAQADVVLRWAHMPTCTFCWRPAQTMN